jgi:hypothetical protein
MIFVIFSSLACLQLDALGVFNFLVGVFFLYVATLKGGLKKGR